MSKNATEFNASDFLQFGQLTDISLYFRQHLKNDISTSGLFDLMLYYVLPPGMKLTSCPLPKCKEVVAKMLHDLGNVNSEHYLQGQRTSVYQV